MLSHFLVEQTLLKKRGVATVHASFFCPKMIIYFIIYYLSMFYTLQNIVKKLASY